MQRIRWFLILTVLIATSLLALFRYSVTFAAPVGQASSLLEEGGQEYIVQSGDWLSKISLRFYGSSTAWQAIVDATNEKAATDPRFTVIDDPDTLEVGQLLWIPAPNSESDSDSDKMDETASGAMTDGDVVSATVRFVEPQDGDEVPPRFDVVMAADGLTVEPAGEIREGAGHFHILEDTDFIAPGELLPFDESHLHFGKGQVTTTLELEPGVHVLRLQFANGAHMALEGEEYGDTITVTVASGAVATPVTPSVSVTSTSAMTEVTTLPSVRFVEPQDGDKVLSSFDVAMEAVGLTVEPAGEIREGAGHFHILVDTDFVAPGELLPFDENHLHFGKGQLTTTLELEPGVHVLRLQFANGAHMALEGEEYGDEITITVGAGS